MAGGEEEGNFSVVQALEKSRNAVGISRRAGMGAGASAQARERCGKSRDAKFSALQTVE
jgi:membrane carboxypeptidase/penicillin-binding protein